MTDDKLFINQLHIEDIVFGIALAALVLHRAEPAEYTGCGRR